MTNDKNIYQRMHAAMKDIGTVKKDKRNNHQGYDYVSEEAIKTACHKALVDHGIVFQLEVTQHDLDIREGQNSQGKPITTTISNAKYRYHFRNIDKPDEVVSGDFCSMAADNSDKSFTKALTYAIREIMKSNFVISTGEPDPDDETPEVGNKSVSAAKVVQNPSSRQTSAKASAKQLVFIGKLMQEKNVTKEQLEEQYGMNPKDMTGTQASEVIEWLMGKEITQTHAEEEIDLSTLPWDKE